MIAIVGENYPTEAGSGKHDFVARRALRAAESQFVRLIEGMPNALPTGD